MSHKFCRDELLMTKTVSTLSPRVDKLLGDLLGLNKLELRRFAYRFSCHNCKAQEVVSRKQSGRKKPRSVK